MIQLSWQVAMTERDRVTEILIYLETASQTYVATAPGAILSDANLPLYWM